MHVILLKTIYWMYWMSSHQNLSIRLISILSFSQLPPFTYRFRQYLLRKTKFVSSFPQGVQTRQQWIVSLNLPNFQACNIYKNDKERLFVTRFHLGFKCITDSRIFNVRENYIQKFSSQYLTKFFKNNNEFLSIFLGTRHQELETELP